MPRPGGESDKLGNRYEGLWTIGRLLDLAAGEIESIQIEPFGEESLGIEFVVRRADGGRVFHSAKRQRAQGEWSLAALARKDKKTGRSILGDLINKLSKSDRDGCCFVSATGANDLRELTERARQRKSANEFETDLRDEASDALRQVFEKYVQPIAGDCEAAYSQLQRMEATLIDEATLRRQVEQHISFLVYRPDSKAFEPSEVRMVLGDFMLDHLGTGIRQELIWEYLAQYGYARRDWASDPTIRDVVRRQNQMYVRTVEADLINGGRILRTEAESIVDAVMHKPQVHTVLVSAAAGAGKSCVIAQVVELLSLRRVPVLVVRLDRHGDAHSSQDIGDQMELPRSPAVILAAIANGREGVLVIDQLDAVSQVSGRYPHLWELFDTLCQEAASYPNLRLVVVCRDFDLENDPQLRKLKQPELIEQVRVELLSVAEVDTALAAGGCDTASLTSAQKEILRTPLHLFLLLDGLAPGRSDVNFANIGELFARYWQRKQQSTSKRLGHESEWAAVIDKLCDVMSDGLTVYVPSIVLDEHDETRAAMLTEHVLVQDGNRIRFFHESFFDYAYARRFCARGGKLMALLLSAEQHLFRRSQVRQILAFMRDQMRDSYLSQLHELLSHDKTRFHIKRLVLAWLGTLPDPTVEEWTIVEALYADTDLLRASLPPIRKNLAWCELLFKRGVLTKWLASQDEVVVGRGMWFLIFDQGQKRRSEIVAELLTPYCGRNPEWTKRLRAYFQFGNAHSSEAIQKLCLRLIDEGVFDEGSVSGSISIWNILHRAAEEAPRFALAAVTHWLDRRINAAGNSLDEAALDLADHDQAGVRLIAAVARAEPSAFVSEILPRVLRIVELTIRPAGEGLHEDRVWGWLNNAQPMGISTALLYELVKILESCAKQSPQTLAETVAGLELTQSQTVTFLLLRAWSANPARFGSRCIQFLAADSRRLDVGYASWSGGGDGNAAVTRQAIEACVPHATEEERAQLEHTIIGLALSEEGEHAGWTECLLLESCGDQHLSEAGRRRLAALRAKFPEQEKALPPKVDSALATFVGSPVPPEAAQEFTDDQWLSAMREFDYSWDFPLPTKVFKGSAVELSRVLQREARLNRRRFAALALRMEDSIRPEYFEAILDGICGLDNLPTDEREKDDKEFEQLETEVVSSVVRRLHRLPNRPCGRSICRILEKIAKRPLEDADLEVLAHYALNDPDPEAEAWIETTSGSRRDAAQDAHLHGYNSVRGHAARVIEALLFADYSRSATLLPLIRELVCDRSLSVRTCAIEAILPMLNHDRDEAVRLFVTACDGADIVIGSPPSENFIRYATSTHYSQLRELLQRALHSSSPTTVKSAARQICLAAFTDDVAGADAESVRNGTESMRQAAAEIYAHNLSNSTVGAICRQYLPHFFGDDVEEIRATAGDCFLHLGDVELNGFADLIRIYIESPAFPSQHDDLLRRLDESTWQLPDVTIRLAERFVAELGSAAADISTAAAGDAPIVSKLVIRLYTQSSDDTVKRRCLDLIDEMERLGFYGIDSQLAELDR